MALASSILGPGLRTFVASALMPPPMLLIAEACLQKTAVAVAYCKRGSGLIKLNGTSRSMAASLHVLPLPSHCPRCSNYPQPSSA